MSENSFHIRTTLIKQKLKGIRNKFSARRKCHRVEHRNPILVYQMGKVGSSTVVETINRGALATPVLHVHTLNDARISWAMNKAREISGRACPEHLYLSKFLSRRLKKRDFRCRIVTLTRDPISRALSFVFENWRAKAPQAMKEGKLETAHMLRALDELLSGHNGISDPSIWFQTELEEVFNVDVFSTPYDFEYGFQLIPNGSCPVLLIRMEDLHRSLAKGLSELLGVDSANIQITTANRATDSWYSEAYAEAKKAFQVAPDALEQLLQTKYSQHFYRHDIPSIRARWSIPKA